MSIDVGIIHLAIIIAKLDDSWKTDNSDFEIIFCELIDITELNIECDYIHCKFYHDKVMCDYIDHLCFKYQKEFESVNAYYHISKIDLHFKSLGYINLMACVILPINVKLKIQNQ